MPRNRITGELPISIGNLSTSLNILEAAFCRLRGPIPSEIGSLNSLYNLNFAGNNLTGELPATLGSLRNLQRLALARNNLHGSLPESFCGLQNLFFATFSSNRLSGQLSKCLSNLSSLQELYLYDNSFNSSIPLTPWDSPLIQILALSRNLFEGSLPNEVSHLKSLQTMDLSENQLSENIPITIGELSRLTTLDMHNNRFNGSIPSSFADVNTLQYLDLSQNNLSGPIPLSLENLLFFDYFNVSLNELSGEIPDGGHFGNFTSGFFTGNRGLCGPSRFGVGPCQTNTKSFSKNNHELLRFILPLIASVVVAAIFILLMFRCRVRKTAFTSMMDSPHGIALERISYYDIVRATSNLDHGNLIGKGGIGLVYKGILSNGMIVAVKVFNLEVQGAYKSFDTECQIMRSLRHRNLVKIATSCSNLDFKALVMEYMPNGNLDKWLYSTDCALSVYQRLQIMVDVASAIEYLHHDGHSSPIVHCDLKPSNILLDQDMVARLGDFGIAKLLLGDQERMEQTKTMGTIGYMAPEYGSSGLVSTSADIYSYGIVLMETFTRKKPTDVLFLGELTMHTWVSESYPKNILQIVDDKLLNVEEGYCKSDA